MTTLNCLIIDDEPLALDLLEDNIAQIPFLHLAGRCQNAFEAIDFLQKEKVDLLFLDIQMPGITGIQFLQSLPQNPMVIFVTAYEKYALEGFNLDVIDYLLKPVPFERFLKSVNKAADLFRLRNISLNENEISEKEQEYFFVNSEYNLIKINTTEVLYIEGLKDYVKIYISTAVHPIVTRLSMKVVEENLSSKKFIRVHKSFIVAIDKIEWIRKSRIGITSHEIPISDSFREQLFKVIGDKNWKQDN